MKQSTILVIEDNPITRKMIRVTLEGEGYAVLEAEDARAGIEWMTRRTPDLVLQDLLLPDMDGSELVGCLRALPGGAGIPIFAVSGFLSKMEQARRQQAPFTDYLFKPVEPSRLLQTIRTYLEPLEPILEKTGEGCRILVAHDDPVQLKLLKVRLEQLGFRVTTARDGLEALEQAKQSPPDAILSDVLMPRLDGFRLCLAVRRHPQLAKIPVILISAAYAEEADRRLAQTVGANAMLAGGPDSREAGEALVANLGKAPPQPDQHLELTEEYTHRLIRQLERQMSCNASLSQRLALREAELEILAELPYALKTTAPVQTVLEELLRRSFNAAGVSRGAVYLFEPGASPVVAAELGHSNSDQYRLEDFFGHADLLTRALEQRECILVPSQAAPVDRAGDLLERSGAQSLVIAPLVSGEQRLGALVMEFNREVEQDWIPFAKALGTDMGQSVRLTRTLSLLRENEEKLARVIDTMTDGLLISDRAGCVTFANAATERIFGVPAGEIIGRSYHDPAWKISAVDGKPFPEEEFAVTQVMQTGQAVYDVQSALERPDGSRVILSVNAAPLRDAGGAIAGVVRSLRDITKRRQAEKELAEQAEKLVRYNAELEQFAYVAAHDLQEPLRTVASFTQLLAKRYQGRLDDQADKYIGLAVGGCMRMKQLIDDLLAYSRIARRESELKLVPSEEAFERSLESLQAAVADTGAVVTHDPLPTLLADPARLDHLFQNLIGNALKFRGPDPPRVHVSAEPRAGEWVFAVRDNGIGIDPQYAERIFQIFERLHGRQEYPGTGVGLAICKRIVEQHRGRIWIESEPGKGATFYFAIPALDAIPASKQEQSCKALVEKL